LTGEHRLLWGQFIVEGLGGFRRACRFKGLNVCVGEIVQAHYPTVAALRTAIFLDWHHHVLIP